jgi:shikimate kinase
LTGHVVLIGLMGTGKTTVGELLARRLEVPFHDSDRDIEAAHGQTVRELATTVGVDEMHALEGQALQNALDGPAPAVIAAAASVADDADCMRLLQRPDVFVVWLKADPDTLAQRFAGSDHRPAFGPDVRQFLVDHERRRGPAFQQAADLALDVAGQSPADLAEHIESALRAGTD